MKLRRGRDHQCRLAEPRTGCDTTLLNPRKDRERSELWRALRDLTFLHEVGFDGLDRPEIAVAVEVLRTATGRLTKRAGTGVDP